MEANLPDDLDQPRFVHIDLSRSSDRCGIAMVKIDGYKPITQDGTTQDLPIYNVEMALSIEPDSINQIDITEIRSFILNLRNYYGFTIKSVTYDGFDSMESMQIWRKTGVGSYDISMDRSSEAYDNLRSALYQDRVLLPDNIILKNELANLERHLQGGKIKIDHSSKGSKDISDAVAGACKAASIDRATRRQIGSYSKERIDKLTGKSTKRNVQRRSVCRR